MTKETGKQPVHKKHVARLEREKQQTRLIIYSFFGILGAVVLLLFYGWLDASYLQLNRPVAKVGDVEILLKDFEPRVRLRRQQLIDNYGQYLQYQQFFGMDFSSQLQTIETQLNVPSLVGQSVLDEMINEEIIRQETAKRGITVSEEELNAEIESSYGYFPNGTPTATVTITPFDIPTEPKELFQFITQTPEPTSTLQATEEAGSTSTAEPQPTATATLEPTATATTGPTSTPLPTATPFRREGYDGVISDAVENLSKYGLGDDYYLKFFEIKLLTEKLKEQITADVQPFETQVRARHILVADEQAALDIIARLEAGEDFAELARTLSTDTGSAVQGGDLGWFGRNQMVPEFEEATYALENPGDFTLVPVQSQFGYHIIQLMAKLERPISQSDFDLAKNVAFQKWLNTARDEEYVVETFDVWQARVPNEPNFITAATEAASVGQTAQAEQLSTLEAANGTPAP